MGFGFLAWHRGIDTLVGAQRHQRLRRPTSLHLDDQSPSFLRELNFCTLTHLRGLVATSCASPFLQFRPTEETEVSLELLQIIQVNCGMDIHQKLVQRGKEH